MEMNDKELKHLYQSYVETLTSGSRSACPSQEDFVNVFDPSSSIMTKDAFIEHITHCAYCSREFQLAREFLNQHHCMISDPAPSLPNRLKHFREAFTSIFQKRLRKMSPALLMMGIAVFCVIISSPLSRLIDGRGRSICIPVRLYPLERASSGSPLKFKWSKFPEAQYILEIYDESLKLVWESPKLFSQEYLLPRYVQEGLDPHRKYFWAVTAISANGMKEESGFQIFTPRE